MGSQTKKARGEDVRSARFRNDKKRREVRWHRRPRKEEIRQKKKDPRRENPMQAKTALKPLRIRVKV